MLHNLYRFVCLLSYHISFAFKLSLRFLLSLGASYFVILDALFIIAIWCARHFFFSPPNVLVHGIFERIQWQKLHYNILSAERCGAQRKRTKCYGTATKHTHTQHLSSKHSCAGITWAGGADAAAACAAIRYIYKWHLPQYNYMTHTRTHRVKHIKIRLCHFAQ